MNKPNYDVAALPGATLAAVLSAFMPKGPYSYISGIVGVTLLAIIYAFEHERKRTPSQTFAVACVCGLSGLLIVGLVAELFIGGWVPIGTGGNDPDSAVPTNYLVASWPVQVFIFCMYDRYRLQPRIDRSQSQSSDS